MHAPGIPGWSIRHDIPYNANFVLWLMRRVDPSAPHPGTVWRTWLKDVVEQGAQTEEQIAELAPDADLKALAIRLFIDFVQEFNQYRRIAAPRLTLELIEVDYIALMGDSDLQLTFLHTNHPGDLCLEIGDAWVLGQAYSNAKPLQELVTRLLTRDG